MTNTTTVLNKVDRVSNEVISKVKDRLAQLSPQEKRKLLTKKEQLQRFYTMSDTQLAQIRAKVGDEEFVRYMREMLRISREGV